MLKVKCDELRVQLLENRKSLGEMSCLTLTHVSGCS